MGFVTGFTGGVTLTLGAAYLALAAHERARQSQSETLRAQTRVLNALAQDPSLRRPRIDNAPLPTRAELEAQKRGHFVEAAKDKWNTEIENAVRWAQSTDWDEVRETAEDATARLLGLGPIKRDPVAVSEQVATPTSSSTSRSTTGSVTDALAQRATNAQHALAEKKEDVKTRLLRARDEAASYAAETKEEAKGVLASAVEKGRHMVGKAKAAVHLAEEKLEARVDAKLLHVSEVEKALAERFEKPKVDPMSRSVEEVLAERYVPLDKRDNSRLRGI
ncbi:hypothetical protein V8F20_000526 [Naviculisporaceae sp. PSN 640]